MIADRTSGGRLAAGLLAAVLAAGCGQRSDDVPAPVASPAPAPETTAGPERQATRRNVTSEMLPYGEVGEQNVYGYFAFPEDMVDPLPAVVVIHDWWGLNDEIREFGNRLAAEGFIVLAVDLFGGSTTTVPTDARGLELGVVEEPELAMRNIERAHWFARNVAEAPSVAVLGFGFGGGLALSAAIAQPADFSAVVTYYGQVNSDQDSLAPVKGAILGLFAQSDRAVPISNVREFERALDALDKEFEIVVFDDARRGFADKLMPDAYDPDLDAQAWDKSVEFLHARMADSD